MEKKLYEKFLKGLKRKKFKVESFDTMTREIGIRFNINKPADYNPYAPNAKRLVPIIFEVEGECNAIIDCYDLPSAKYVHNFLKKHNIKFKLRGSYNEKLKEKEKAM